MSGAPEAGGPFAPVPDRAASHAPSPLARFGAVLTDFCERWFPDAFVFALAGVVLTRRAVD